MITSSFSEPHYTCFGYILLQYRRYWQILCNVQVFAVQCKPHSHYTMSSPWNSLQGSWCSLLNLHSSKYFLVEAKLYDLAFWHILCKATLIQTYTFYYTIDAQNSKNKHNITLSAVEELQVRDVKLSLTDTYYRENLCRVNIVWVKSRKGIWTEGQNKSAS